MLAEFLCKDVKVVREVAAELGASLGVLDVAIGELEALTRDLRSVDSVKWSRPGLGQ